MFTYHVGYDLLGAWLDAPDEAGDEVAGPPASAHDRRQARFARLLVDQVTPSAIQSQLEA
ncbi:MAG: hypothetical protein H0T93_05380 [Chloroflexia bacterium]|nr:hypothetical protein [Chloroflexia bacterium]